MNKLLSSFVILGLLVPTLALAQTGTTQTGTTSVTPTTTPISPRQIRNEIRDTREEANNISDAARAKATSTKQNMFCTQIDKVLNGLETRGIKMEDKRMEKREKAGEKRDETREKVDARRAENELKMKEQFARLSSRATTDLQKQAVATFITVMNQAIATRDAAIDAILKAHRDAVDAVVTSRKTTIDAAILTLQAEIESAKAKARADCGTGVSPEEVRTTLRTSAKAAQEKFKTTVQSIEKAKDISSAEKETRKREVDKVHADFKATMEKARAELKAVLKAPGTATTTTTQ